MTSQGVNDLNNLLSTMLDYEGLCRDAALELLVDGRTVTISFHMDDGLYVRVDGPVQTLIGPVDRYKVEENGDGSVSVWFMRDSMQNYLIGCGGIAIDPETIVAVRLDGGDRS